MKVLGAKFLVAGGNPRPPPLNDNPGFLGNWPPTPPLTQDFALSEKQLGEGYVGSFTET